MKVQNKVIIVTGAGSGMGRELALNLLSKGAKVIAIDINNASLLETATLAKDKKDSLETYVVDITNRDLVEAFARDAIRRFG